MPVLPLTVHGIVQGVGFRPFAYRLARDLGLGGWVANSRTGVCLELVGTDTQLDAFLRRLRSEAPPLAAIESIDIGDRQDSTGEIDSQAFVVRESMTVQQGDECLDLPPPDAGICPSCLAELGDPANRRSRHPFISCTDCGPRYSMITRLPYDRPHTSMDDFPLCPSCLAEYRDAADRRFHAESICCPHCGPRFCLSDSQGRLLADGRGHSLPDIVFSLAGELLRQGKIIAVKGLGGFHLVADASCDPTVAELRRRKNRPDKPLAVMATDIAGLRCFACVNTEGEHWLSSPHRPVVLLQKKTPFPLAAAVAPDSTLIGAMLPAAPHQYLLLDACRLPALVMTSGNRGGLPIVRDNDEALAGLAGIADFFLFHDRHVVTRVDDSVLRPGPGPVIFLRRARGFVPRPIRLAQDAGRSLALGGAQKTTICLTRGREAFVSQHIGNTDTLEGQENLEEICRHLTGLLGIEPDLVVHDLHPDWPCTGLAKKIAAARGIPVVAVQHHHAHAVSCMAEHGLEGPVLALCMDGSGMGTDGTIWGGEILLARNAGFSRIAHFEPVYLPGGDVAAREPWRMAASHLRHAFGPSFGGLDLEFLRGSGDEIDLLSLMMEKKINCPLSSSCGRLFDAAAALLGICRRASYEGQAAAMLELAASPDETSYDVASLPRKDSPWLLPAAGIVRALVYDLLAGADTALIAGRFHSTLARLFADTCRGLAGLHGVRQVVLGGGVFQNRLLMTLLLNELAGSGIAVFAHKELPAGDGGLSFGQAIAGRALLRARG